MKIIKLALAAIAASCFAHVTPVFSQTPTAANSIEGLSVGQQGGEVLVKIDLKEPLATPPAGFSVASPARVAFDFPLTANALGRNSQTVNEGDLKSLNIVQAGDRTRVVMNLVRNMNYTTRVEGKSLLVTLSPVMKVTDAGGQKITRFSEESLIGQKHAIRDIAFRRGKDGEGRIVVDLGDSGTGIDIRQQGTNLVVDFLKTTLPDSLRRKLDVTDFATPVTGVVTEPKGENVRMVISPKGLWEHNAYQSDNQFVVEVKQIVENPNKLVQGSKIGYQGPRVSINYQNGDIRALLRLMAEELGLNAVISETVTGTTTLVLKDVPADQVIDIIFQQKGLDMRKNGNVILIAPRDEIATREKLEFEAKQQISDLEPIRLESFQLSYQKAIDVRNLLTGTGGAGAQRILSKRGNVTADPRSNIIFVNDIPSKLEEVRAFIKAIDIGAKQVLIEARVVEANDNFNKDLGVKMNFLNRQSQQIGNSGISIGGGSYTPPTLTSSTSISGTGSTTSGTFTPGAQTTPQTIGVNLPSYSSTGSTIAFSLFNASLTRILNLELAALETDGGGKIISSPRVVTANNVTAKIEDGTEVPYVTNQTGNGVVTQTVSFKSAKLSLETTPQIMPEGTIRMKLVVKKEEPDWTRAVGGNPPIKSSIVETDVVVENGGTVVIGGVYKTDNTSKTERVPFFGDLPYVGWLFKYKHQEGSRRELLVFITPRIVSENLRLN